MWAFHNEHTTFIDRCPCSVWSTHWILAREELSVLFLFFTFQEGRLDGSVCIALRWLQCPVWFLLLLRPGTQLLPSVKWLRAANWKLREQSEFEVFLEKKEMSLMRRRYDTDFSWNQRFFKLCGGNASHSLPKNSTLSRSHNSVRNIYVTYF